MSEYQGNWRGARQYNFEDEVRRKKAAQRARMWRERWDRLKRAVWWPVVGITGAVLVALIAWKPLQAVQINSASDAVRHLASSPNCDAARAVGLAPARRGQPGYWPSHDRDKDGVACEPYRGW